MNPRNILSTWSHQDNGYRMVKGSNLAVVFLGIAFLFGCAGPTIRGEVEPPEVYLSNIAPLEASLFEQKVQVDLRIQNPNNFDLQVTGIDFHLDVNEVQLTRAVSKQKVTVPGLGESVLSIVARTTAFDIVRQVLASREREEYGYAIRGRVHLGNASVESVPFERSAKFTP